MTLESMTLDHVSVAKCGIENRILLENISIDQLEGLDVKTSAGVHEPQLTDGGLVVDFEFFVTTQVANVDLKLRGIYRAEDELSKLPQDYDWKEFVSEKATVDMLPYVRVYVSQLCGMIGIPAIPIRLEAGKSTS